jgi:hypothetical protein
MFVLESKAAQVTVPIAEMLGTMEIDFDVVVMFMLTTLG